MLDIVAGIKCVDSNKLIQLLSQCPDGARLIANQVGNLLIIDRQGESIGYIDFNTEEVISFVENI